MKPDATVRIEPMQRRHVRSIVRIERRVRERGWSAGLFQAEIARGTDDRSYIVARTAGSVVGYAGVLYVMPDAHVTTISVDPTLQHGRIGTRLMVALVRDAVARGAENLTLEMRAGNEPALALYRRFGLAPAGLRKNYYADTGDDALIMWAHDLQSADYRDRLDAIDASLPVATEVVATPIAPRVPR